MSKEHTPTPWQIHKFKSAWDDSDLLVVNAIGASPVGRNQKACVESADGLHILDVYGATEDEALANAQLAYRAVNSHEALVEAIKDAIAFAERDDTYSTDPEVKAFSDKMAALLALADKDS